MLIRRRDPSESPSAPGLNLAESVHVLAPAKINLYLEVLGKRPDNYHDIATLMLAIELYDELDFAEAESSSLTLECDAAGLSSGPENLVIRAAMLLKQKTGCTGGAKIRLTKRIPWAAGLGGGSSDAAATLAGLNELWQLHLSTAELAAIGSEIGSDVPFFFYTPAAWCTGRGEQVEPVPVNRAYEIVLVKPTMGLNTAEVYKKLAGTAFPKAEARSPIIAALADGDPEQVGRCLHNRLQGPAFQLAPTVAEIYRRLQNTGAAGCLMSGSGSSLFALCRDRQEAQQVADALGGVPSGALELSEAEPARIRVFLIRSCA